MVLYAPCSNHITAIILMARLRPINQLNSAGKRLLPAITFQWTYFIFNQTQDSLKLGVELDEGQIH
jgi:hypothetical protein